MADVFGKSLEPLSAQWPITCTEATLRHMHFMNKIQMFLTWNAACQMAKDGFLFIRGHLLTEMDSSVAWVRASPSCCLCKDCAHSTPLSYTVSWHTFSIPKFSNCRCSIISLGSHHELNTPKPDWKYFNISWEIDHHVNSVTSNQTH